MSVTDEIITIWKQQGAANFRKELRENAQAAMQMETSLSALAVQMERVGRIRPPHSFTPSGGSGGGRMPSIPGGGSIIPGGAVGVVATTTAVNGLGSSLMGLAGGIGGLYAVRRGIGYIAESAGKVQMATVAFKTLLGSSSAAAAMVKDLQVFAAETPFDFSGSLKSAQQLKAMGFSAKEIVPVMTTLGDAVAAIGGDSGVFGRVSYNLGQIRTQGKATAMDIRQFAMAGLNVVDIMKAATGQTMTLAEITATTADTLVPNLLKGMDKLYSGTMKEAGGTIPQAMSNMQDSFEQLASTVGETLTPVFVGFANAATGVANSLKGIADNSKGAGLVMGVAGAGASALAIRQIYRAVTARGALTKAVIADIGAERTKTGVAGKEGLAIDGAALAARRATKAKTGLAAATNVAGSYTARLASETERLSRKFNVTSKVGKANIERYVAEGLAAKGITQGSFAAGEAAAIAANPSMFTRAGRAVGGARNWAGSAYQFGGRGFNSMGGASITNAGMAGSGLLAGAAGIQSYQNYKALGKSSGESMAAATATGLGAFFVANFVPGGKLAVAMGTGIAWGINKYYNEPMEKAAQGNMSDAEIQSVNGMSASQKAAFYDKKASDLGASGDNTAAMVAAAMSRSQKRLAEKQAEEQADAARDLENKKVAEQRAFDDRLRRPSSSFGASPEARRERNSDWIIRLPATPADKSYEKRQYNSRTPMPSLAR